MDLESTKGVVCIVDDDDSVRRALTRLVESSGLRAEAYASPRELLEHDRGDPVHCLLLDVQLPGMSGFELNDRLVAAGRGAPVVFITAHPDGRTRARAADAGAEACLEKPFDDDDLLEAIQRALDHYA
jgi:FixJ family two-component response regulator